MPKHTYFYSNWSHTTSLFILDIYNQSVFTGFLTTHPSATADTDTTARMITSKIGHITVPGIVAATAATAAILLLLLLICQCHSNQGIYQ